jgi:hypothetical protein
MAGKNVLWFRSIPSTKADIRRSRLPIQKKNHRSHSEDEAWRCIGKAMTVVQTAKEKWSEAEVNRIAGEISLKSPEFDESKTQAYLDRSLEVARAQFGEFVASGGDLLDPFPAPCSCGFSIRRPGLARHPHFFIVALGCSSRRSANVAARFAFSLPSSRPLRPRARPRPPSDGHRLWRRRRRSITIAGDRFLHFDFVASDYSSRSQA